MFCMNKLYFSESFFLTDWRYKRRKNVIRLLLLYGEHFYGFSESECCIVSWKSRIYIS